MDLIYSLVMLTGDLPGEELSSCLRRDLAVSFAEWFEMEGLCLTTLYGCAFSSIVLTVTFTLPCWFLFRKVILELEILVFWLAMSFSEGWPFSSTV